MKKYLDGGQVHEAKILDERHVITPIYNELARVCSLAVVDCYAFSPLDENQNKIYDIASLILDLPEFTEMRGENIHLNIPVDDRSVPTQMSAPHSHLPFYAASHGRVVAVHIGIQEEEHQLVIPVSTIVSRLLPSNAALGMVPRAMWAT